MAIKINTLNGHSPIKRLWMLLVLLVVGVSVASSQVTTVSGTVLDENSDPAVGATVTEVGTQNATVTDIDGKFSLKVTQGCTLSVSYVGYFTTEVRVVPGKKIYDIKLKVNSQVLDDVVVVGYGTMKRSDLTGSVTSISVTSISESQIKQGVNTSIEQAMQGRIAGVQVMQNSGQPGGAISVQIRGINSLNGNEPLYIIDGVAVSGQTGGNKSVLSSLNPADIVSLEVLKDASATAIYGSRASNGVVLITTRRGEEGGLKFTYDGYAGWQQLPGRLEVMDLYDYADFYNTRTEIMGWGIRDEFSDPSLLTKGTDWKDELFRTAFMHSHQVGVSGGNKTARYALSGGYLDQDGIGLGSSFKRATFRVNFDSDISSWLSAGVSASYANTEQVTTLDANGVLHTAINQCPDIPAKNPDGSYGFPEVNQFSTYYTNPLFDAQMRDNHNTGSQFYYNVYANIKPVKGLNLRLEYGGNKNYDNVYNFSPSYQLGPNFNEAYCDRTSSNSGYWSLKTFATYDLTLKNNKIQLMACHEAQESNWESLYGSRKGYISNSIHSLDVGDATTAKNGSGGTSWSCESWFDRLNYNFDDRYLLTATIRTDGSSNLGENNRWGTFPSAAIAWRISNEGFMKHLTAINNLKLHLGWGKVGNQKAGNYAYGVTMNNVTTAWGNGYYPGNYGNPNLKWEETEAWNADIDLSMFSNRIEFIAEAYYKTTDNLLMQATLPSYIIDIAGVRGAPWVNAGAISNKGLEFTLNTVNIQNRDFSWRSELIVSFNRNKFKKLYSADSKIFTGFTQSEIGQPVGQFYGYKVIGMFTEEADFYQRNSFGEFIYREDGSRIEVARPAPKDGDPYAIAENSIWVGDYIFEDVNKDGRIDEKDRQYIGNPNPDFTFGFNNTFTYKDFTLQMFFNGSVGNDVYNNVRAAHTDPLGWSNKMKDVASYARVEKINPEGGNTIDNVRVTNAGSAKVQRVSGAGMNMSDNNRVSSRFVEDGSYIRLKTISLTYNLPRKWLDPIHVGGLSVYANAQNLFTITSYKGYDPEIGAQGQSVVSMGLDNGRYPSQRIYNVGLKLNF